MTLPPRLRPHSLGETRPRYTGSTSAVSILKPPQPTCLCSVSPRRQSSSNTSRSNGESNPPARRPRTGRRSRRAGVASGRRRRPTAGRGRRRRSTTDTYSPGSALGEFADRTSWSSNCRSWPVNWSRTAASNSITSPAPSPSPTSSTARSVTWPVGRDSPPLPSPLVVKAFAVLGDAVLAKLGTCPDGFSADEAARVRPNDAGKDATCPATATQGAGQPVGDTARRPARGHRRRGDASRRHGPTPLPRFAVDDHRLGDRRRERHRDRRRRGDRAGDVRRRRWSRPRGRPILTNNLFDDLSQVAIRTDAVDAEQVAKPRPWSVGQITRYILFIGPCSSVFDSATFFVMLSAFGC